MNYKEERKSIMVITKTATYFSDAWLNRATTHIKLCETEN